MTIQMLPSGRWRARVWVPGEGDVAAAALSIAADMAEVEAQMRGEAAA